MNHHKAFNRYCGTPGCIPPETFELVAEDQVITTKTDIYCSGLILYTLIVGQNPFICKTQNETIQKNKIGRIGIVEKAFITMKISYRI